MNIQVNKYTSYIFAFCLFLGGSLSAFAQGDAAMRSKVRDKAISLIANEYDAYANVNNDEAFYSFLRLFASEEVSVFNDLLGVSTAKSMPAGDYARLLSNGKLRSKRVSIKNVKVEDEPKKVGERWKVVVTFDKELSYYNDCDVYFSSKEFYGTDYHLSASMIYDDLDDRCRIERIDGYINSGNSLPKEYQIFKKGSERDKMLSYHSEQLTFNSNNQAVLKGRYDSNGFTHPKYSGNELKPSSPDDCNIVTMSYGADVKKSLMIKPYIGFDLGSSLSIGGDEMFDDCKSSGFGLGVDVGYPLVLSNKLMLSAFAGIGIMSTSLSDMKYEGDYHYSAGSEADVDGDSYERYYKGLTVEQSLKLTDLSIPIYLEAEFGFSDALSAYVDLGLRLNLNMSNSVNTDKASVDQIYGVYSKYKGAILDGSWPFNGFTNTPKDLPIAESGKLEDISGMTTNLLADVGLRYTIPNSNIAVGLGVGIVSGLGDIYKQDKGNNSLRYVEYTTENGEQAGGLVSLCESIKRQSMRVNLHLIYKF